MKTIFFSHELGLPEFFRIWCEIELRIPPFQKRGVNFYETAISHYANCLSSSYVDLWNVVCKCIHADFNNEYGSIHHEIQLARTDNVLGATITERILSLNSIRFDI